MIQARVNFNENASVLWVRGTLPHYRMPPAAIMQTRRVIHDLLLERRPDLVLPMRCKIHLRIAAKRQVDGGDLQNIVLGVCHALDSKSYDSSHSILCDDGQIISIGARWTYDSWDHQFDAKP